MNPEVIKHKNEFRDPDAEFRYSTISITHAIPSSGGQRSSSNRIVGTIFDTPIMAISSADYLMLKHLTSAEKLITFDIGDLTRGKNSLLSAPSKDEKETMSIFFNMRIGNTTVEFYITGYCENPVMIKRYIKTGNWRRLIMPVSLTVGINQYFHAFDYGPEEKKLAILKYWQHACTGPVPLPHDPQCTSYAFAGIGALKGNRELYTSDDLPIPAITNGCAIEYDNDWDYDSLGELDISKFDPTDIIMDAIGSVRFLKSGIDLTACKDKKAFRSKLAGIFNNAMDTKGSRICVLNVSIGHNGMKDDITAENFAPVILAELNELYKQRAKCTPPKSNPIILLHVSDITL